MKAVLPWDAYDAEISIDAAYDAKRKWDQKNGYSQQKVCSHPFCDAIIRDKSTTCKAHREWRRYGGRLESWHDIIG